MQWVCAPLKQLMTVCCPPSQQLLTDFHAWNEEGTAKMGKVGSGTSCWVLGPFAHSPGRRTQRAQSGTPKRLHSTPVSQIQPTEAKGNAGRGQAAAQRGVEARPAPAQTQHSTSRGGLTAQLQRQHKTPHQRPHIYGSLALPKSVAVGNK